MGRPGPGRYHAQHDLAFPAALPDPISQPFDTLLFGAVSAAEKRPVFFKTIPIIFIPQCAHVGASACIAFVCRARALVRIATTPTCPLGAGADSSSPAFGSTDGRVPFHGISR
jgi:hypothetical protein